MQKREASTSDECIELAALTTTSKDGGSIDTDETAVTVMPALPFAVRTDTMDTVAAKPRNARR